MPEIEYEGVRLHYELSGRENGDVLVLGNSLGSSLHMWDKVLPRFEERFRLFDLICADMAGAAFHLGRTALMISDGMW